MDIESLKSKLAAHRAHSGRREIPEEIWRDACALSQTIGVGAAGKLLGLNSVRIKYWASQFGVEIPSRIKRKTTKEKDVVRVAEVKFKASDVTVSAPEMRKVLEMKSVSGLSLSFFESGSDLQFEKFLQMMKEVM